MWAQYHGLREGYDRAIEYGSTGTVVQRRISNNNPQLKIIENKGLVFQPRDSSLGSWKTMGYYSMGFRWGIIRNYY